MDQPKTSTAAAPSQPSFTKDGGSATSLRELLRRRERELILDALRDAGWNQSEAARRLELPRRTLAYKLKALGIAKLGFGPDDGEAR